MPLIEKEVRDYLIAQVSDLNENNCTVGVLPAATKANSLNMKAAAVYSNGGESEERIRIRVMTRDTRFSGAMDLANDIYTALHRLHTTNLVTYALYMVIGQRPQQSGREENGGFLTSADYLIEFRSL